MTKSQSLFFRFLLFFFGVGIVLLAFFFTSGDRELTRIDAFMWVSIGLMYLFFFIPFFFSSFTIGNFSAKIPNLTLVWTGILLYIIASVAIILLTAAVHLVSLKAAIIGQAVLVFLFALDVYAAYFASSHIGSVAAEESDKMRFISKIKTEAGILSLSVDRLPAEYEAAQKILRQTLEAIKYIYPVDGGAGSDLELKIISSLDALLEICKSLSTGAHSPALEDEAANLQILVKQRKLLRN